jgi:hypothetical protein
LWLTEDPDQQLAVLNREFSLLMETLARHDIPVTLMWYPRITRDPQYTYGKLKFLMPEVSFDTFSTAFTEVVRPERVHKLSEADA